MIFFSYSRLDSNVIIKFANLLSKYGYHFWIDIENIPKGEIIKSEILEGILLSDIFIFFISLDSILSEWCNIEIDFAIKNGKRIIPILISNFDLHKENIHPEINKRNWIYCESEEKIKNAIDQLIVSIENNNYWVKQHTKYLNRAKDWYQTKDQSKLLWGNELKEFIETINRFKNNTDPRITDEINKFHQACILKQNSDLKKQKQINFRQRISLILLSIFFILILFSLFQIRQQNIEFLSIQLSDKALLLNEENEIEKALLLSLQANDFSDIPKVEADLFKIMVDNDTLTIIYNYSNE